VNLAKNVVDVKTIHASKNAVDDKTIHVSKTQTEVKTIFVYSYCTFEKEAKSIKPRNVKGLVILIRLKMTLHEIAQIMSLG